MSSQAPDINSLPKPTSLRSVVASAHSFIRRNSALAKFAVLSNMEYRLNFLVDAVAQPIVAGAIEMTLWLAVFASSGKSQIAGFGQGSYLAYAFWSAFIARITITWMYEHRMIEEIESGSVNSVLVRPIGFFEYYLSQFMGYKVVITFISLLVPLIALRALDLPTDFSRLPGTLALTFYYLIFVQILSFCIACVAFHLNRIYSLTAAKNLAIWLLSGELIPIDLYPSFLHKFLLHLPFSSGVYVPVGYITGRIGIAELEQGFFNTTIGILVMAPVAWFMWRAGVRKYTGTGA